MKTIIFYLLCLLAWNSHSQTLQFNKDKTYQTIHSFGASDCWSQAFVGKYYPESKKKQIADWLFSRETDQQGNPKGIGLSLWRFNIGAGSSEQGEASKISSEWRRAESFLSADTYDWEKQKGQQWFLEAAKKHGVPYTLGFMNAAPVQMSRNGLAIGSGKLGEWNFNKSKIDAWASFLATVSAHFQFDYISPFNEPQWDWGPGKSGNASQEGTPITNADIAWATRKLNDRFQSEKITTRIVIPEAGQLNYLVDEKSNRPNQDNQIDQFFSQASPNFLGNLASVDPIISGHSYFTTSPENRLIETRQSLHEKLVANNVQFWQSEFCILGDNAGEISGNGVDLGMKTALYVAKVIHADLTVANATSWSWWLAVSANDYKDGLIYTFNGTNKGENEGNKYNADLHDSKTMWALGNYARFIRPGMQRIDAAINQPNCLISGFKDKQSVVFVIVNAGEAFSLDLPKSNIKTYTTTEDKNLAYQVAPKGVFAVPAASIITLVMDSNANF
jgi:hypothetical protein